MTTGRPDLGTPVLIDLGDTFAPEPDPAPVRRLGRRWARAVRLAVPTVLSLVLIAGATGATPPPIPVAVRVPASIGADLAVFGDRLIVLDALPSRHVISEYGLADGHRWTASLDVLGPDFELHLVGDTVIVGVSQLDTNGVRTEAFDLDTGRKLWDSPDGITDASPAGDLILSAAKDDGGTDVYRKDARTGAVRWRVAVPAECSTQFTDMATKRLVTLCTDDSGDVHRLFSPTLRLFDLDTGAALTSRVLRFPLPPPASATGGYFFYTPTISIVDNLLLVAPTSDGLAAKLDAYRLSDLAPLWSGPSISTTEIVDSCAPVLCLSDQDGIQAIDPLTGRPTALPPDPVTRRAPRYALVAVSGTAGGTIPLDFAPDGVVVEVPVHTPGRAWLGRQRPDRIPDEWLTAALIQPLSGVGPGACEQVGAYLACGTAKDEVTLWRLPG